MAKEKLKQLFNNYDPIIQGLISDVLTFEQAHISIKNLHYKEQIDQIISRWTNKELERAEKSEEVNMSMFE